MIIKAWRKHLFVKIISSYLVIIFVWIIVMLAAIPITTSNSFYHHAGSMSMALGEGSGMGMMNEMTDQGMAGLFFTTFRGAVYEAIGLSTFLALIAALAIATYIAYQMVTQVKRMTTAAEHIAQGNYSKRVTLPANSSIEELDEMGQLAHQFNRMAANLEETENMRRKLIGDVAHELRTPLTTIKGSMEGLMDNVLPATDETFDKVHREAERLQRLTNDLQELSRVESGAYALQRKPTTAAHLINGVVERLSLQFEEKGVHLKTKVAPNLPEIAVDEDRILQVLINLAGNALQYTPENGDVSLSAAQSGDQVFFSVVDSGEGIAEEHLPFIFTRFYRVDKSRSRASGGSGIGLTISHHLVEAHGGQINADSPGPGKGSAFTFSLPIT
jgi:signal transduction histidine kinase